ncbi:hypothetical protein NEUTE1DRAFT_45216 [Neurospora tetrasperma FGSC 2508]|uniref:Uncharacterized protein n=1 Tax=Neurospora tetrasperma (strain FGSC 2508 / ATCC MYA-4615 / P0657) TaxID=510951 RepID=F8MNV4_NEUT8|nr:uncharacterized protein NEUTE1DRAFT_45216 [Neurospora tetrasperma FGSC 2508]EGO57019.1 hypothetical protein NEUTE1DRAFT_45216 [Neurospora tetrasperma FGSC 2508]EGZ70074.1 hypothetical protein NEUTE2DRAFT_68905 [Neurospora tetrasperma FGSC 2509]
MCSGIAVVRIRDSQVRGFEAPGAAVAFRYESTGSDSGSDKGVQVNVNNQAVKASSQDSQAQINNAWLCAMRHKMEVATLGSRGREAGERYVRDVMPPYGVWAYQSDPGNIPSRRPRSAVLGRIGRALSNLKKKGPQFGNLLRRFGW